MATVDVEGLNCQRFIVYTPNCTVEHPTGHSSTHLSVVYVGN